MHHNPDLERITFVRTVRMALAHFAGQRLVLHVRSLHTPDWVVVVALKVDGTSVFTIRPGVPRSPGPSPIRMDSIALNWNRPRNFVFAPRSRQALIDWLDSEVHQHNNEVSTHD